MQDINEILHGKLDAMGAPPSEMQVPPAETLEDKDSEQPETGDLEAGAAEETQQQPDSQGETPQRYTATELADAIGWEVKDLYEALVIPYGDGQTGDEQQTITLGELKDQRDQVTAQRLELQKQHEQLQQEATQFRQAQQQLMQGQQVMSQELQDAMKEQAGVQARYDAIDWADLRKQNPIEYTALRQDFAMEAAQVQAKVQQAQQAQQQQMQAAAYQQAQEHQAKLLKLVPEWSNEDTRQKELAEVQKYLVERGFVPQELDSIRHSSAYAVARDGWLWREHQRKMGKEAEKFRKAPKPVMRPGAGIPTQPIADRQRDALAQRALETGRTQDKLAAARAIFGNANAQR